MVKQNSMKLVHKSLTTTAIFAICVAMAAPAPLATAQNPNAFKPAQANLTEVFLQIAGSLEATGSPEAYLRHMQEEHLSIAAKYHAKTGHELKGIWPAYMTDAYVDQFIANWKLLVSKLHVDALAQDVGKCAREAIQGANKKGTVLIDIFNKHQDKVYKAMQGKVPDTSFADLKAILARELEFGSPEENIAALVAVEKALSDSDQEEYSAILKHEHFTKAEFAQLEHFYSNGYDKLSEEGKRQMSRRVWDGMRDAKTDNSRADAISAARSFRDQRTSLYAKINTATTPEKAQKIENIIDSAFIDLGQLAEAEFELALIGQAVQ